MLLRVPSPGGAQLDRTAELRWFFRRPLPGPVVAWFERFGGEPAERVDLYLALRETDALGVKVRGGLGHLEFKLRETAPVRREFPGGVAGALERWQRWSFARGRLARLAPRLGLPPRGWVAVRKRRRLAVYRL